MNPRITPDPTTEAAAAVGWGRFAAQDFGSLWLVWSDIGLVQLAYNRPDAAIVHGAPESDVPDRFGAPLEAFFAGEPIDLAQQDIPLDLRGTAFQLRVWSALMSIPRGSVRTYGGIALDIDSPRAMRAVGMANGRNPVSIIVPCHRVVAAGHGIGGYTGGLDRKRALLRLEGVQVEDDQVRPGQLTLFDAP